MADVWSGDILLSDDSKIQDITFASQNVASRVAIPSVALRFLATVDTARIPLYLAAGPSLDVWTTSDATEEWFSSMLLSKGPIDAVYNASGQEWWTCMRAQSPVGILVKVDGEGANLQSPRITEILFYGTVAAPAQGALPTPPSSSPELLHQPDNLPVLKVHALPLSSDLLYQQSTRDVPSLSPALDVSEQLPNVDPQFLPPLYVPENAPGSPKRKRDIFDEAAQARKKARGKGGEGVAAAAARAHESQRALGHRKFLSVDTKVVPLPDSRPNSAQGFSGRPPSRQLSRSPSISSDIRPLSRKGATDTHTKRSGLSRVATLSLQPEEPTTETRNKEALSRVVMAAMRMYGLQQRKKNKSRRNSIAPGAEAAEQMTGEEAAAEAARDEEYKLIYHQTYKGAALALRKHMATKPLHSDPDRLRDVVEKLLAIFCTDPLAQSLSTEGPIDPLATPGCKHKLGVPGSNHSHATPFDLPSATRMQVLKTAGGETMHTGSPVSRRKVTKAENDTG